jgi:hypothetical protein
MVDLSIANCQITRGYPISSMKLSASTCSPKKIQCFDVSEMMARSSQVTGNPRIVEVSSFRTTKKVWLVVSILWVSYWFNIGLTWV